MLNRELLIENARRILADEVMCFAMSVPYFISNECENNAQMVEINKSFGKVDRERAVEQFNEIYKYCSNIFRIYIVPSLVGLQDQVYVSNLGATFGAAGVGGDPTIILSKFAAEGRTGEELVGESYFRSLGFQTRLSPHPFEGEADLKCIAPDVYVGAVGMRTTYEALRWIEDTTSAQIIDCHIVDKYLYHLDCVLFRVTDRDLAVVTSVVEKETLRKIEKHINIIDVPYEVGLAGATNCVRGPNELLCDENVLLFADSPILLERERKKMKFLEILAKEHGLNVKLFQTTEFIKSGAALSCMFMRLNWV